MKAIKWIIWWVMLFPIVFVAKRIGDLFDLWSFNEYYIKPLRDSAVKPGKDAGADRNKERKNTENKTK